MKGQERVILFNVNGVLVNTRRLAVELYNEIARDKGYRLIPDDRIEAMSRLPLRERCRVLGVPYYRMALVGMAIRRRYQQQLPRLKAVEGLPALLEGLKKDGYQLGLITSNGIHPTRAFLEHNGIGGFDYEHYTSNPFSKRRNLKQFAIRNGLAADSILYVGDELRDLQAGSQLGIRTVGASWGYDSEELLQQGHPAFTAASPEELLSRLRGE